MSTENFIPLENLCTHYNVELSFFSNLNEIGLIEIQMVEQIQYIHQDSIYEIEKMIRMHQELDVNLEGIDVVFNLLQKIDSLKEELTAVRNRLRLYEN
ncbi:chaperone modulator CbpM [Flavobacterium frigoris]|uniref:chaperone modulator CbpM n=1 Tax=Flavobacterium frigoris TaxID=229204 RepID=UPI00058B0C84|nr:chaperone modulator CbpM [Flavobacterium frigoris]